MDTKKLRQKILDLAIRGKLVQQDPNDEPASVLLERIREEKGRLIKEGKIKRDKKEKTSDTSHYRNVPFDVPEGWVWTRLSTISISIQYGITESAKPNGDHKFLRITDIQNNRVDWESVPHVCISDDKANEYLLYNNDIVFARTGATVGKSYVISNLTDKAVFASYLIRIKLPAILNVHYIKLFLESGFYWEQIADKSVGIGQPNVNGTSLGELILPIPPLPEQLRIASETKYFLTYIDTIEENKLSLGQFVKQIKSKVLDLAIRGKLVPQDPDDEPASVLLERIRNSQKTATPTSDISHYPFEIPEGWVWCRLSNIVAYLQRGKSPKYSPIKKYPVLAQKCNQWSGITLENAQFFEPETFDRYTEERFLQTGDIIINSTGTGTLGRIGLFNSIILHKYECIVADSHITVVRCNQPIVSEYIYHFFCSDLQQRIIEDNAAGSTNQKELYINAIKEFYIPLPPYAEQNRIVSKIEQIFTQLDKVEKALKA